MEHVIENVVDDQIRNKCLCAQLGNYEQELEDMKSMSRQEHVAHLRR